MDLLLKEVLGSNFYSDSYIACSTDDEHRLYRVKVIKPKFSDEGTSSYLQQQLAYMAQLNIFDDTLPELIESDNSLSLKYPFVEHPTLAQHLKRNKMLSIEETLQLGIAVCECLEQRHQNTWVHKGIKPNNILYNPVTGQVSLLDDLAVITANQLGRLVSDGTYCEESLAYQSPEQCGRVRLDVDYRTDLYSLGCVLYHCIAGHPPFWESGSTHISSQDIIHSHLAETPEPLTNADTYAHQQCASLYSIIAALLEKETEKRYQTALGLKKDLLYCLQRWQDKNPSPFPLQREDIRNEIVLPSILLGRRSETLDLLTLYQQVCEGELGVAYVTGLSGIGKSRLVQELEVPILLQQGLFASGKYNQFSQHQPYATIAQAIGKLVRFILTETEERLQQWRQNILDVVGINGQLLIAVIPELFLLIGDQPEVNALPPIEARNRFNDLFCRFMMCLATKEHPFVLFIDDLQWCDEATLDVLDQLLAHPYRHPYLLLILAFRNNEVAEGHRILHTRETLHHASTKLLDIELAELDKPTVNEMVAYILSCSSEGAVDITNAIYPTCGGNPLLVNESLRWLHQHQGIYHDDSGRWQWDEKALGSLQLPEGYLALFSDKLNRLTAESQNILGSAALLGARFKADDLAALMGMTPTILMSGLSEALTQRIVISEKNELYFSHDQIQRAAAKLHSPGHVIAIHKQIAQRLIDQFQQIQPDHYKSGEQGQRLYSIAEHLKKSRQKHASDEDNFSEATFNQLAGEAALNALAHSTADYYFSEALNLCSDNSWKHHYDFMLSLYKNYARSALLVGEQDRSNETIDVAMQQAENDLDRADCLLSQIVATTSLGNIEEGISLGLRCSQLLQNPLPADADSVEAEIRGHALILQNPESLARYRELPDASDKKILIELALYGELLASFYVSGRTNLFFLSSMRSIVLALEFGKSNATAYAFGVVGTYFHLQQEYSLAKQYEISLLKEVDLAPYDFGSIRAITQALWLSLHHSHPIAELKELCRTNIKRGIRAGELNYTGLTFMPLIWLKLAKSDDFEDLKNQVHESFIYCDQYAISQPLEISRAIDTAMMPLWGDLPADFHQKLEQKIEYWHQGEHIAALCNYYFISAQLEHHQSNYANAEELLIQAEPFLIAVPGTIIERLWYVYRYLTGLHTGDNPEAAAQMQLVSTWADYGPLLKPYLALMEAETLAIEITDPAELLTNFWPTIGSAQEHGYLFLEAHVYERLGVLLDQHKHQRSSLLYLHEAQRLYIDAKANLFAEQLGTRFHLTLNSTSLKRHSSPTTSDQIEQNLDSEFLLQATEDIMKEKNYDALLMKILSLMMARVGAKNAYLIIVTDDDFIVRARGRKNGAVQLFQLNQPMDDTENLCPEICRYAIRSHLPVVLGNATNSDTYGNTLAVHRYQLKSVLALPLLAEDRVLGLIYLENALIPNVFSEQEVARLQLLTTQASIALDNNLLISNLEQTETTLRQGEIQLKDEQVLLAAMLDNLGEAVILMNHHGEIDRFNHSASFIFGYSEEEICGEKIEYLLHGDITVPTDETVYLSRLANTAAGEGIDVKAERKNGEVFPFHITVAELPLMEDRKRRFVASGQDLTSKELQQAIIQRSQKMDAMGKLTGGIVHDYNNMLGVIIGFGELLEKIVGQDSSGQHYLQQIQNAAERSAILTSKLLSYSRQKPSQPTDVDINRVLLSQQDMLNKTLTVRVQLLMTLADNLPAINVDLSDLENAILNICINAMHAMSEGGRLVIQTQLVNLNNQDAQILQIKSGDYVLLNFSDNGSGIDQKTQDKVFDPFFSTKGEMGTGLGLSQAYGLMERSHGIIRVDSTLGQGACFSLYFPISKTFEMGKLESSQSDSNESTDETASILVVDDEPAFTYLIREALQGQGYSIFCAGNAIEAMDIIRDQSIDLVLSDILMPETNGYQLAEQIQQHNPNIIIQLISGFDEDHGGDTADNIKPSTLKLQSAQLTKPLKLKDLIQRVAELLKARENL